MNEYQLLLIINLIVAAGIIIWINRSQYEGKRGIIYLLALTIPIPTLIYLLALHKFTDQMKRKDRSS